MAEGKKSKGLQVFRACLMEVIIAHVAKRK